MINTPGEVGTKLGLKVCTMLCHPDFVRRLVRDFSMVTRAAGARQIRAKLQMEVRLTMDNCSGRKEIREMGAESQSIEKGVSDSRWFRIGMLLPSLS